MGLDTSADANGLTHKTYKSHNSTENQQDVYSSVFDFSDVLDFQSVVDELRNSNFFTNFEKKLQHTLGIFNKNEQTQTDCNNDKFLDIVCYGLGNFLSSDQSKYQFAFLIILKNILSPKSISIFDPEFTNKEKCILQDFGLHVMHENECGKRNITNKTIFFMPHCPYDLYDNLLWANWSQECLSQLIIIGNVLKESFLKKYQYITSATKLATEVKIKTNFQPVYIFNTLYIYYFCIDVLSTVPVKVWMDNVEPVHPVFHNQFSNKKRKSRNRFNTRKMRKVIKTCNRFKIRKAFICNACEVYKDE